ncbi:MAG: hypothetical protein P4L66_14885 [Acetobacteraceae bacterium]|nr:hypothetical protein [Acetobacteraceae bacterium]
MAWHPDFLIPHLLGPTVQLLVISGLVTHDDARTMLAQADRRVGLSPCMRHTIGQRPPGLTKKVDAAELRSARQAVVEVIRAVEPAHTHPKRLFATAHAAAAGRLARKNVHSLVQAEITRRLFQQRRAAARAQHLAAHS